MWDFPSGPWQRHHIDYAGPFYESMWLIWIDAYSKYGGAEQVSNANGVNTVRKLREIFALLGDPEQIVSDNGTPFTSREFGEFCNQYGIRHIRSASYHTATNGEAERFVQVFKRAIRANSDPSSYSTSPTSTSKYDRVQSSSFSSKISYRTHYYRTITIRTTFRTNDSYDTQSYSTSVTASSQII